MTCTLSHVSSTGGLRERKKQQTTDALVSAALELFGRQGYERTTVREITDIVGVSERTFFRYFAGKEELVVSLVAAGTDRFLRELAAGPACQAPVEAMLEALRRALHRTQDEWPCVDGRSQYSAIVELIESTPTLLSAHLAMAQRDNDRVVRVLAERFGVDPATDARPQVLAAAFAAVVAVCMREWRGGGEIGELLALIEQRVVALRPALADRWG
jgi:AcrR family transcriptional regulator